MLEELNVEIVRKSMDNRKNNFGNRLLELCRCNNIFICNGRIGGAKGISKFTSKNASVVDYAICSPLLFKIIDNFSVLETSKLFSDIHNPLSMAFNCIREKTSTMLLIYTVNMCWSPLCTTKTNNINKTRTLLQTGGGKNKPNIVFMWKS
jgi:hypothetical protein